MMMLKKPLSHLLQMAKVRPAGYVEDVLSFAKMVDEMADFYWIEEADFLAMKRKYAPAPPLVRVATHGPRRRSGPGTELKRMLAKLGIKPRANCQCNRRAREMDLQGGAWCERNIETIVGWLREEAAPTRIPFSETVARIIIRRAIKKAHSRR